MQVRLVYHDNVQNYTKTNVEMIHLDDSATVASLLSRVGAAHPEAMGQLSKMQLSRGGQPINPDAFLQDGDIVDICLADTATA